MGKSFTLKLAVNNIKNNRKFYLPYFLAAVGIIAMFYIIIFLAASKGVQQMSASLSTIMVLGVWVMGIFAFIFLFYTNSFLMKRRKKEIGLYNILGMEKKHIGKILAIENMMISLSSIVTGLLCGILFSKLVHLILSWVFGTEPPFGFEISWIAMVISLVLFGILFTLTMLTNQMSIHLAKPIELLNGGNVGEKEPKTKWLLAILGVICLGIGYYIAITTESPLTALMLFFVAVILVIIGTYCLFTAGSVALLKSLKKNKKFYYKPANFTAVSGLIYRMKQNAVGLASICILSTMVLVMVSGTVSLYAGMGASIKARAPGDASISVNCFDTHIDGDKVIRTAQKTIEDEGLKVTKTESTKYLSFMTSESGDTYKMDMGENESADKANMFALITADEYQKLTGGTLKLAADEAAVYTRGEGLADTFRLGGTTFRLKQELDKFAVMGNLEIYMIDIHYMVVADDSVLTDLYRQQKAAFGNEASPIQYQFAFDMTGTDQQKMDCTNKIMEALSNTEIGDYEVLIADSKQAVKRDFDGVIGGFLFLGIFLGIVFTFAAGLIIYYKQISEGYYDKEKFEIMQKVGMSKREVKKTIKKQVLLVFFIPLVMAGIHILAAFKMITRLLLAFSMTDVPLFALCTAGTFLVFAVIYAIVYAVTAREYYKIVG